MPYLVLVISLHDDDGRVGLDILPAAVNQNLIKHHELVPGGRQSFLNDLTEKQTWVSSEYLLENLPHQGVSSLEVGGNIHHSHHY